jgi:hypothetical protein
MGVPAVNIGSRQRGRERGRNVLDVPYDRNAILDGLKRQMQSARPPHDERFGDGRAGERIAERLAREPLSIEKRLTY